MPVVRPKRLNTIRAVQPNEGVREWYQRQLDELLSEAHTELTLPLSVLLTSNNAERSMREITGDAAGPGAIEALLKRWGAKWRTRFDKMSEQIAQRFAKRNFGMTEQAMRASLKAAGFTVTFKPTRAALAAYKGVIAENINLIKSIQSQYLTGVQSAVWSSVNRGADMATLSKTLQKNYRVTTRRAALIARDQNAKAKATIEQTRRLQLGITQAIWQHSTAGKEPRPTHVAMSGKVFDLKRGMWDADEQEWVLPGQLINCRCTSRAIIPELGE